jgi:hypothetical protein
MYQYIQRLSILSPESLHHPENRFIMTILTEQAQSYLAAMNALKFVHPDSAWFNASLDMNELTMDPVRIECFFILSESVFTDCWGDRHWKDGKWILNWHSFWHPLKPRKV